MPTSEQPFVRRNYYLIGGCVLLIIIGFLLMLGSGSSIESGFNIDIFSTRRVVIGPTITFLGFLLMAFAIMYHNQGKKKQTDTNINTDDTATDGLA